MTKEELIDAIDALEADAVWPMIAKFVAEWLDNQREDNLYSGCYFRLEELRERWLDEMGTERG